MHSVGRHLAVEEKADEFIKNLGKKYCRCPDVLNQLSESFLLDLILLMGKFQTKGLSSYTQYIGEKIG